MCVCVCVYVIVYSCDSVQGVRQIWYYNWEDFTVPPIEDSSDLHGIMDEAVGTRGGGEHVLVSCVSGRGRSGTLSAMLAAKMKWGSNISATNSVDDLVNIVVGMREFRDGLVETPQQFQYISNMLGILPPASTISSSSSTKTSPLLGAESKLNYVGECTPTVNASALLSVSYSRAMLISDIPFFKSTIDFSILSLLSVCLFLIIMVIHHS